MSQDHQLQAQRFELKYIIREEIALMVRNFVATHLELDEFSVGKPNNSYAIHSLYLDSEELALYWHTVNGNKNRYKLRIRFYDEKPESPVFFEIKRRVNNAILKQRCGLQRAAVGTMLAGQLPENSQLLKLNGKQLAALQEFSRLLKHNQAVPTAQVSYLREAWVSPHDNSLRVTVDREVRCSPEPTAMFRAASTRDPLVFGTMAILEIKFTDRFPDWLGELVWLYGLRQVSAAKYADGILKGGIERFSRSSLAPLWIPPTAAGAGGLPEGLNTAK